MGQFQSKLLLCIACNSLKSQQFHLVQICILLRFMSTFLVCTQFLTEKIIDKGENWISPRYASHTPNFSINCMDPYPIRTSVSRLQICILHLGKILSLCGVINKTSLLQNFCPLQYTFDGNYTFQWSKHFCGSSSVSIIFINAVAIASIFVLL